MRKSKSFIIIFISLSFLFIISIPIFNYYVDRYRVFNALNGNYEYYYNRIDRKFEYTHNDRFMPMAYLVNEKHHYDSFVFGNSRVNNFDVSKLGNNWYRINYNSGEPYEHLHNLKLLLNSSIHIKEVILTIDESHFLKTDKNNNSDKKFLYPVKIKEWVSFYYKHLFKIINSKDIDFFMKNNYFLKSIPENYLRDKVEDTHYFFANDKRNNDLKKRKGRYQGFKYKNIDNTLDVISEFVNLCKIKNVNFKLIILPTYYKKTFNTDIEKLKYLKKNLSKISKFYDFSFPHNYTINNAFWRESTHYTRVLNDEIIRFIQSEKQLSEPFGTVVNENNVDAIVEKAYTLSKTELASLKEYDTNVIIHKSYYNKTNNLSDDKRLFIDSTPYITNALPIVEDLKSKKDLEMIKMALENYYKDNHRFPVSKGFDGLYSIWGYSEKDWIKGLVPKYLKFLPIDSRLNENSAEQYLYKSNGKDYKIISHHPRNCMGMKKLYPHFIDTKRDCWAYGFWTEGAKGW